LLNEDPTLANKVDDYITYYLGSGAPIKNAAAKGQIEIVKLLLEHGADPNLAEEGIAPDGHALHSAVCNGHMEVVKLLLAHGAHPNVDVESSADTLLAAIARKNEPMVELLCSHGAASKLHLLAYYGDVKTAAAMLAANPALADDPETLENAVGEGKELFVRLLLRYQPRLAERVAVGVPFDGPDAAGKSTAMRELLFQHGMDVNLPDWLHITALHRFAKNGDVENAIAFINNGANLNARDEELSSTPLGWAAKFGRLDMVKLLLERGADPDLPGGPAWATPLAWAKRRGHTDIVELLLKWCN
jgi:ankyrin repeat protein